MIDVQAIKDGDFVEFKSPFGMTEIGIYKSETTAMTHYHEVWVNGNPLSTRYIHEIAFIGHEPAIGMGRGRVT